MVGGDRRSPPRHRGKGGGVGGGKGNKGGGGHGASKDGGAATGVKSTQVFKVSGGSDDGNAKIATGLGFVASALSTGKSNSVEGGTLSVVATALEAQASLTSSKEPIISANLHKDGNSEGSFHGFEVAKSINLGFDDASNGGKEKLFSFSTNLHKEIDCFTRNLHKEGDVLHASSQSSSLEVKEVSSTANLHKEDRSDGSNLPMEDILDGNNLHKKEGFDSFGSSAELNMAKSDANVFSFSTNLHKEECTTMAMEDDSLPQYLHKEGEMPSAVAHDFYMEKSKLSCENAINAEMRTYVKSPIKNAANISWADLVDNQERRTVAPPRVTLFNNVGQGNHANLHISGGGENRELNGAEMDEDTTSSQGVCDNAIGKNSAFLHKEQLDSFGDSHVNVHRNGSQTPVKQHPHARNVNMQRPNAWARPKHIRIHGEEVGSITRDGKVVTMDKDAVNHNISKLRMALVGRLIGKKLPFSVLDEELHRRWECFGEFNTVMIDADCFICTFQSHEARDAVLIGGPWQIAGHIIGLDKWTPKFKANSFSGLSSPVWIRFPHLPLMYWDATNITRIATMVGEPLWLDVQTSEWGRSAYARVCVRLELDKKLPTGVWVEGIDGDFFQKVMFEGISILCFKCGIIGHKDTHCTSKAPCDFANGEQVKDARQQFGNPCDTVIHANHVVHGKGDIEATPSGIDGKSASVLNVEDDDLHGPWTLVSRRRKAIPKGKGRGELNGRFTSKSNQNQFKGKHLDNTSGPGGMLDSSLQTSRVDCLQEDCAPVGSIVAITATSKSMQQGAFSFGATLEVGEPSKVGADLSPLKEVATHKSLKPRVGQSRVSKAHFEKELQSLGPIAELPRKRKKLSEGLLEDLAPDQLVNSRGQLLLTNTDGGDASPLDNG